MRPLGLLIPPLVAVATASAPDPPPDSASVSLVHAVPGVGSLEVQVNGADAGSVGYGDATSTLPAPAGRTELEVTFTEGAAPSPGQVVPEGAVVAASRRLEADGVYTAVALPAEQEGGVRLRFLRTTREGGSMTAGDDGVPWLLVALAVGGAALGMIEPRPPAPGRYRQPP